MSCIYLIEIVKTQCFEIVGSRSYAAAKVYMSIVHVLSIFDCFTTGSIYMYNILNNLQRVRNESITVGVGRKTPRN